ncbi:MAG: type VI secretion system tip protein VgrG [Planctomycetaceae bacterium]|nr:type VI secretion system tip protein VgrG [Planctomycetaceae bacterium]
MPKYSQANRPMAVSTPLGPDVLLLQQFSGSEFLSRLFRFQLEMLAESSTDIAFDQILGQSVTVTLQMPDGSPRYFNGIVNRFSQGQQIPSPMGSAFFTRYLAEIVPQFWLLTRKAQSRIFQQIAVPDILKQVLTGLSVDYQLQGTYKPRDYCVQYRETDFNFASRLMEEEGIYYFFNHADGSHKMVVADTPMSHPDVPGATTAIYEVVEGGLRNEDRVQTWEKSQEIRSGKYTLWDQCFELPGQNLEAVKPTLDSVQAGTVSHKLKVASNDAFELYDFPGGYAQRFDGIAPGGGDRASDVQNIFQDNARTVGLRMQQETTPALSISGRSTCRQFTAGYKFTLDRHFNANGAYVLTQVGHFATMGDTYTAGSDTSQIYENTFECIPSALPFKPPLTAPRPTVEGTQTAIVVGNPGDEIFTDKYGRVKVQFPWDRKGQKDANSSCWARVATFWAGKQWGIIHIPRVGQEVVVAFEEGDPDRPIIVGSVYNAENMPPYTLPDNKTQSGYLSRSTLQGTDKNFNQLRFEDKKDSEEVYFHAEKDFNRVVENNDTLKIGFDKKDKGDHTVQIFNNESYSVGTNNCDDGSQTITIYKDRTETVKTGNESVTIEQGNRTVTVSQGNDTHEIKQGNREVTIDMGNDTLTIKMGNQTTKLNLGSSSTEAMQSIELKVGQNSIKIDQMGVTIQGMMVSVKGQVQTQVQGTMVQVSGDAMTQISGGITMIG